MKKTNLDNWDKRFEEELENSIKQKQINDNKVINNWLKINFYGLGKRGIRLLFFGGIIGFAIGVKGGVEWYGIIGAAITIYSYGKIRELKGYMDGCDDGNESSNEEE